MGRSWTGLICARKIVGVVFEHGNEISGTKN
jgi:hypothetical protein